MQALALNKKQSMIPMPSKRTSAALSQNKPRPAVDDHVSGTDCLLTFITIVSLLANCYAFTPCSVKTTTLINYYVFASL